MPLSRKIIRARRRLLLALVAATIAIVSLGLFGNWFIHDRDQVTTDNAFVTGNIIPVHADATGVVAAILAEETQLVKKGDTLVALDGQRACAAVGRAEAELARAVRSVGALFASRRQICEKIASRKAVADRTRHDLARYRIATQSGAASRQLLQNAEDQLAAQEADLREARAEYDAVEAHVGGVTRSTHPDVASARAKFDETYVELLRQNIRAPATGYVAKRRAQVGERVKPGDPILNIVPLDHLWVEANLWENQMKRVRPGQSAAIVADLYGSAVVFHGIVEGIVAGSGSVFALLPPDNATGNFIHIVQRVPVRIALRADELEKRPLRLGLSTAISIDVSDDRGLVDVSRAETSSGEYATRVFEEDLARAESRAEEIVRANLVGADEEDRRGCAIGE